MACRAFRRASSETSAEEIRRGRSLKLKTQSLMQSFRISQRDRRPASATRKTIPTGIEMIDLNRPKLRFRMKGHHRNEDRLALERSAIHLPHAQLKPLARRLRQRRRWLGHYRYGLRRRNNGHCHRSRCRGNRLRNRRRRRRCHFAGVHALLAGGLPNDLDCQALWYCRQVRRAPPQKPAF